MRRMLRGYVASGWFNHEQVETYNIIKTMLDSYVSTRAFKIFYPKEESKYLQDSLHLQATRSIIYRKNLKAIDKCDFVTCSTESKDVGSLIEVGYAIARKKPIVYVNFHLGDKPFNLMLTESALAIAKTPMQLGYILRLILMKGLVPKYFSRFRQVSNAE